MLKVVLYEQESFIPKEYLPENTIVVCPHALTADRVRNFFKRSDLHCLTISYFLTEEENRLEKLGCLNQHDVLRKADLLLILSLVWKKISPHSSFSDYYEIFNLFTEFRSYSLDKNLWEDIICETDPSLVTSLLMLETFFETLNLVDEQQRYVNLREAIQRLNDVAPNKISPLCFWGFDYINIHQIDMIKCYAQKRDVHVMIPRCYLEEAGVWDWPQWIISGLEKEQMIHFYLDDGSSGFVRNLDKKYKVLKVSPENINFQMDALFRKFSEGTQIHCTLLKEELVEEDFLEAPFENIFFKSKAQWLENRFREIIKELKIILQEDSLDVDAYLKSKIFEAIKNSDMPGLKCTLVFQDAYKKRSLSLEEAGLIQSEDKCGKIDTFDLELLEEIGLLNLTRNYFTRMRDKKSCYSLGSIHDRVKDFSEDEQNEKVISLLLGKRKYGYLGSFNEKYSLAALMKISQIAPAQTKSFQRIIKEYHLSNAIEESDYIILESGIEDNDQFWGQFLKKNQHQIEQIEQIEQQVPLSDLKSRLSKTKMDNSEKKVFDRYDYVSPSQLKLYQECPKKFFYTIVWPVQYEVAPYSDVETYELGQIQHDLISRFLESFVIQDCYECNKDLKLSDLKDAGHLRSKIRWDQFYHDIKNCILSHPLLVTKNIRPTLMQSYTFEIADFVLVGVIFLKFLYEFDPTIVFSFEKKVQGEILLDNGVQNLKGTLDCLLQGEKIQGVLDFKRGKSSIPSKSSHLAGKDFQVPLYLRNCLDLKVLTSERINFWGYLCLSDFSSSLFFLIPQAVFNGWTIKDEMSFASGKGFYFLEEGFDCWLEKCAEKIKTLVENLKLDQAFLATPEKETTCYYCALKSYCVKVVANDVEDSAVRVI